jgi:hypothetical protein
VLTFGKLRGRPIKRASPHLCIHIVLKCGLVCHGRDPGRRRRTSGLRV